MTLALLLSCSFGVQGAPRADAAVVRGVVSDPLGAVAADATVTATGANGGGTFAATSGADGTYVIDSLPAGQYVVTATLAGFGPFERSVGLLTGQELTLDVRLELPRFAESVVAEAEPGNFVLETKEIELIQPRDMSDLLANESMVAVGGGSTVAQKIYVRGFEDVLLNVTIDGAQQAGELYHHQARVQVEPEFLKTIELEAGAGPATAGAGALTGAMRVRTKDAFDLLDPERDFGLRLKGSAGLNGDDAFTGSASAYGRLSSNVAVVVSGLHRDSGDYADGNGDLVEPTAFVQDRGYAKLSGAFTEHRFDLSYEEVRDDGTYYERPNLSNFTGTYVLSDHEMTRRTAAYNHRFDPAGDGVDVQGSLYWTSADFENHRNTTGALYGMGEFTSFGLDLRNTSTLGSHALTYGADYRHDESSGTQQATPPPFWGSSEQTASVFGLYVQDTWRIVPNLTASAGLRFDSYDQSVDSGVGAGASNDSTGLSPNVSLEWEAVPGLSLRGAYARAFRGITIREAFFSAIYVHRGDLEPETADNFELGFAFDRNGFFARGTWYNQHIEHFINAVFDGETAWGYWENVGRAEVKGYELELGRRWQHLSLAAGVWDAENTIDDRPLTDADLGLGTNIGRTWTARVDWELPGPRLDLGLRARFVEDEPNTIAESAPDKPGFSIVDVHAEWRPLADQRFSLHGSVTNLFGEFYYDHATYGYSERAAAPIGFPSRGRTFVLSASYAF